MTDPRLIDELVRRAKVSAADAEAVLDVLAQLTREGRFESAPAPVEPFVPTPADVDALIDAARRHPLGVDFLIGGHLGSVAATFKTHAFTVEAARARIWSER